MVVDVLTQDETGKDVTIERGIFEPSKQAGEDKDYTIVNQYVYFDGGMKTLKVEMFRKNISNLLKSMKFAEYDSTLPKRVPTESSDDASAASEQNSEEATAAPE